MWNICGVEDSKRVGTESVWQWEEGQRHRAHAAAAHTAVSIAHKTVEEEVASWTRNEEVHDYYCWATWGGRKAKKIDNCSSYKIGRFIIVWKLEW